jgi:hypothetical protein
MHVQPFEDANGNFALQWNSYEGKSIIGYRIEGGDSYKTFQPIEDVPRQNTTYTVNGSNMKQSYRVLALFPDTCYPKSYKSDSGPYSLSLSNIAESKLSRISPDNELISSVVVSPNPAAMVCHVKVVLKSEGQITIDILSLKGQVIKTVTPPRSKTYVVPINLDGIPAGIYEIQVTRNNSQVIKQLIIE